MLSYTLFPLLSLLAVVSAGDGKEPKPCCNVKITPDMIPEIKSAMPVFKLCDQVEVPHDYLSGILKNVAPDAKLSSFGKSGGSAAFDGDKLVAFVNPETGESRVFPSLECLKPGKDLIEKAKEAAEDLISDTTLFPKDDTSLVVLPPTTLSGSTSNCSGNATNPEQFLGFAQLQRQIDGIPVQGPGTQATIAVNSDGCIQAFAHRYRPAVLTDQSVEPHCPEEIVNSIIADLADTCSRVDVAITEVIVSYYDGGNNFIQPIYSYQGLIQGDNTTSHGHISGGISIGTQVESIKPAPDQNYPSNDPAGLYRKRNFRFTRREDVDPTVGRYIVRADSLEWISSATAFYDNLQLATSLGSSLTFTDKQYLAADPSMFVAQKNDFINSVQIALNEVHGNWWEFTTYKNFGDIVTLAEIAAAGGLGSNAGGCLAYWLIHSCEVLPTQTDESISFDIWWKIFRGLHSVVGYRTDMWIDDGVTTNVGLWIGLGAGVVPAWFLEIATNNLYGTASYLDANRNITEPFGRPSAVSVCGHLDDTAHDVQGLEDPKCLVEIWIDN
jgi:hypothetical protein